MPGQALPELARRGERRLGRVDPDGGALLARLAGGGFDLGSSAGGRISSPRHSTSAAVVRGNSANAPGTRSGRRSLSGNDWAVQTRSVPFVAGDAAHVGAGRGQWTGSEAAN